MKDSKSNKNQKSISNTRKRLHAKKKQSFELNVIITLYLLLVLSFLQSGLQNSSNVPRFFPKSLETSLFPTFQLCLIFQGRLLIELFLYYRELLKHRQNRWVLSIPRNKRAEKRFVVFSVKIFHYYFKMPKKTEVSCRRRTTYPASSGLSGRKLCRPKETTVRLVRTTRRIAS